MRDLKQGTHSGLVVGVQVCSSPPTSTLSCLESMRQEEGENELDIPQTVILEKIKMLYSSWWWFSVHLTVQKRQSEIQFSKSPMVHSGVVPSPLLCD